MLDLSSITPRQQATWYEFRLHHYKAMQDFQRTAHIRSMHYSMGRENQMRLRLVLTVEDDFQAGADPWSPDSYKVPGKDICLMGVEEAVIRRHDLDPHREFAFKLRDGAPGFRPMTSTVEGAAPTTPSTPAPAETKASATTTPAVPTVPTGKRVIEW